MLPINELREGSIVSTPYDESKIWVLRASEVTPAHCEIFSPIPITPEWVKKYQIDKQIFPVYIEQDVFKENYSAYIERNGETVFLRYVNAIHELQNLQLAINDKELICHE